MGFVLVSFRDRDVHHAICIIFYMHIVIVLVLYFGKHHV